MARESKFQAEVIRDLKDILPGCLVLKNDTSYIQGIPDLLVLYKNSWAALECKRHFSESFRPNQKYYLDMMDNMSFASMICPENKEEVFYDLQRSFTFGGTTRISKR